MNDDVFYDRQQMKSIFSNFNDGKVSVKFTIDEIQDAVECLNILQHFSLQMIDSRKDDSEFVGKALARAKMCETLSKRILDAVNVGEPNPDHIS